MFVKSLHSSLPPEREHEQEEPPPRGGSGDGAFESETRIRSGWQLDLPSYLHTQWYYNFITGTHVRFERLFCWWRVPPPTSSTKEVAMAHHTDGEELSSSCKVTRHWWAGVRYQHCFRGMCCQAWARFLL